MHLSLRGERTRILEIEGKNDFFFSSKAENLLKPEVTLWSFSANSHNCYFRTRNQRKDE